MDTYMEGVDILTENTVILGSRKTTIDMYDFYAWKK